MNPVVEFLVSEGLEKEAGLGSWMKANPAAASAVTLVGAPLALMAAQEGFHEVKGLINRSRGFKRMMTYNPKLKQMPATKVKALYGTLHNVAPDLAKDPVVASSWVNRMAYHDEYVDPKTLSDLGAAQQRIGRQGLEFPIGQVTAGLANQIGDASRRQFDEKKFEHQKTQDVVTLMKNQATLAKERAATVDFGHKNRAHQRDADEERLTRGVREGRLAKETKALQDEGFM